VSAESPAPNTAFEASMRVRTTTRLNEFAERNVETDLLTGESWFWTTYTYTTAFASGNNMLIDGTTPFGVALQPGDNVNVQPATALPGWRCVKILNTHGGVITSPSTLINIRFVSGAFVWRNQGTQIQESQLTNVDGIRIVYLDYQDNSDVAFRLLGSTQPSNIIIDSSVFRNFPTLFAENSSSMSAFGGDTTKMFRHIKILNSTFDSTQNGNFGDFINVGAINTKDFWYDLEIANCTFTRMFSNGGPSHAGTLTNVLSFNIHDNIVDSLGMLSNPNGHAAVWNIQGGFGTVKNNHHSHHFGNDFRIIGIYDMPNYGIVGADTMQNNLFDHKRKYPAIEPRDNAADITTLSPYVRKRSIAYAYNNTGYSFALGTGLTPPSAFVASIYDWDGIDSVVCKNNSLAVLNDSTYNTSYFKIVTYQVGGAPLYIDSSNNTLSQFFSTSGLADTVNYYPAPGGRMAGQGVPIQSFITDAFGNIRVTPWDIGWRRIQSIVVIRRGVRVIAQ